MGKLEQQTLTRYIFVLEKILIDENRASAVVANLGVKNAKKHPVPIKGHPETNLANAIALNLKTSRPVFRSWTANTTSQLMEGKK